MLYTVAPELLYIRYVYRSDKIFKGIKRTEKICIAQVHVCAHMHTHAHGQTHTHAHTHPLKLLNYYGLKPVGTASLSNACLHAGEAENPCVTQFTGWMPPQS